LERQAVDAGLREEIRFAGGLARITVARLVSRADVVALPSIRTENGMMEGIPVALMEALACETPVVSTRISGIPELVEDGVTGLLVPPGDVEALADALLRLRDDPELRHLLGQAGREKVLREFDQNKSAARLAEMFAEAVERAKVCAETGPPPNPLLRAGGGAREALSGLEKASGAVSSSPFSKGDGEYRDQGVTGLREPVKPQNSSPFSKGDSEPKRAGGCPPAGEAFS
jgi:hypothetical protein